MAILWHLLLVLASVAVAHDVPHYSNKIAKRGLYIREQTASSNFATKVPVIDLGYARYEGYYDSSFDIFSYRGVPNYTFEKDAMGDEDCLFLNVFTPANKTRLPVLFWIHGGGYGQDWAANYDFSHMAKTVGNGFVTVIIQYRLGAFGFASSAEIGHFGVPNAGIHDMRFALEWVQDYIHLFGGDPARVTIAGESAGGGGVMLMTMAHSGSDETLFQRAIVSSPYLPTQWDHDDMQPSQAYYDLATKAGCLDVRTTKNGSVFTCLQNVDSNTLQNASAFVSMGARWGQWAFLPVTDGKFITQRPTEQLLKGQVNGKAILSGNNANEGTLFVPTDITARDKLISLTRRSYPLLTDANMSAILEIYDIEDESVSGSLYPTNGLTAPFATSHSEIASGWLQAAYNLYAEVTFVCPAMWLADAFALNSDTAGGGKQAWRYQYSPPPSFHDDDLDVLMKDVQGTNDTDGADESVGFRIAFQSMWGRFVIDGDPTLTDDVARAVSQVGEDVSAAQKSQWLPWGSMNTRLNGSTHAMLNLNLTSPESGKANFRVVDGLSWEGGRGNRCKLWADLGYWIQS
ncbi:carboxylesterase [Colletotrichum abscissum]|uniref:carboxylesterase n=1 Tax=Colletotrichum abscissum TaxID=1671311 RepID=UPI0027D51BF0|nr:carboxylesterase [Colletotrichum abscissum]KAK1515469.1 carboxylesterase [Colletotrichum abscissum]